MLSVRIQRAGTLAEYHNTNRTLPTIHGCDTVRVSDCGRRQRAMAIQLPPLSWTVIKFPPKYAVYIRGGTFGAAKNDTDGCGKSGRVKVS